MKAALKRLALGLICLVPASAALPDSLAWRPLSIDGHKVRWVRPAGERLVLTWRIASGEESYPDAVNCRRIGEPRALLGKSKLSTAALREEIAAAFAMWQAVADITFVEVDGRAAADISIGAQIDPVGRAFTDVRFDRTGSNIERPITRSLICLNPAVRWKSGFDGNLDVYDLRVTLAHEIGHAIGLDHPDGPGSLMWFRYSENSRQLQRGDIQGAVALYGEPRPAVGQIARHE